MAEQCELAFRQVVADGAFRNSTVGNRLIAAEQSVMDSRVGIREERSLRKPREFLCCLKMTEL